jgi:hypothetical protein
MKIGIDLDGVCYDFTGAFCRYAEKDPASATKWEFYKDWGWTTDHFLAVSRRAVRDDRLFRWGDLIPGTKEAFDALYAMGHTIHLVTDRCSLDPEDSGKIIAATKVWLDENNLSYSSLNFTGDKDTIVKELGLDFFLDDKLENYEMVLDHTNAYLFDQPWNQCECGACRRVSGWPEFVDRVHAITAERAGWPPRPDPVDMDKWSLAPGEVRVTSETGGAKGQKQARLGSLDPQALLAVAMVAGFGELKYSRLNYLNGYDWSLSFDALIRHLLAFWSGEDLDPESGLPHLAHAAWHCLCLLAFMQHGLGTDDRYVKP